MFDNKQGVLFNTYRHRQTKSDFFRKTSRLSFFTEDSNTTQSTALLATESADRIDRFRNRLRGRPGPQKRGRRRGFRRRHLIHPKVKDEANDQSQRKTVLCLVISV